MTAAQAIARSITHDEIVVLDITPELEAALLMECDDHVDARYSYGVIEFWGRTDDGDGDDWRVHLRDAYPTTQEH